MMAELSFLAQHSYSKYVRAPGGASERGAVFLPLSITVENNTEFRMMLEGNRGFIYKKEDSNSFQMATTIGGMLNTIFNINKIKDVWTRYLWR